MAVTSEKIDGTKIINEIKSANLKRSEYDVESKKLIVDFNNGTKYEYSDVPHNVYTQFRMSESQGKFFSSKISKVYSYKKL
jgi:hypothetical protein